MSDDVLELLDSIDKNESKTKGKKARKPKTKDSNNDIMGFLDEIRKEGEASRPVTPSNASPAPEPKAAPATSTTETEAPTETDNDPETMPDPIASISSWWSKNKGGIWESATTAASAAANRAQGALKQAEARVKELQTEQQPFNIGQLQTRFTSVLRTIVPPISAHEQLSIHIFHDMVGYPSIDGIVYSVFERIMDQVEGGGELNLIVQKGKERHKAGSDVEIQKNLNAFKGTYENGEKLARANVEDFTRAEEAKKQEEDSPARITEIFLSIQPVITPSDTLDSKDQTHRITTDGTLNFVIYLADRQQSIELSTVSQSFPGEWADWLDAPEETYKDAIADPRQWALEWIEDGLGLAVGVLAQKYVTMRMGISKTGVIPTSA